MIINEYMLDKGTTQGWNTRTVHCPEMDANFALQMFAGQNNDHNHELVGLQEIIEVGTERIVLYCAYGYDRAAMLLIYSKYKLSDDDLRSYESCVDDQ